MPDPPPSHRGRRPPRRTGRDPASIRSTTSRRSTAAPRRHLAARSAYRGRHGRDVRMESAEVAGLAANRSRGPSGTVGCGNTTAARHAGAADPLRRRRRAFARRREPLPRPASDRAPARGTARTACRAAPPSCTSGARPEARGSEGRPRDTRRERIAGCPRQSTQDRRDRRVRRRRSTVTIDAIPGRSDATTGMPAAIASHSFWGVVNRWFVGRRLEDAISITSADADHAMSSSSGVTAGKTKTWPSSGGADAMRRSVARAVHSPGAPAPHPEDARIACIDSSMPRSLTSRCPWYSTIDVDAGRPAPGESGLAAVTAASTGLGN